MENIDILGNKPHREFTHSAYDARVRHLYDENIFMRLRKLHNNGKKYKIKLI